MTAESIRRLNDQLRKTFAGGRVVTTSGVAALPDEVKALLFDRVRNFEDFTLDDDPHDERDFGAFHLGDQQFIWKIDYYDERMKWGSEDPSDPAKTTRVLTIMLGEEY